MWAGPELELSVDRHGGECGHGTWPVDQNLSRHKKKQKILLYNRVSAFGGRLGTRASWNSWDSWIRPSSPSQAELREVLFPTTDQHLCGYNNPVFRNETVKIGREYVLKWVELGNGYSATANVNFSSASEM